MIYTVMTKKAMKLCFEMHISQTDKSGMPYVFHPFHIAEQMKDEMTATAALLHDIIEDTDTEASDLVKMGFPYEVVSAIELLTHKQSESYDEYIRKIKKNEIARKVKIEDLKHNSDLTRLDHITCDDKERLEKYKKALTILCAD